MRLHQPMIKILSLILFLTEAAMAQTTPVSVPSDFDESLQTQVSREELQQLSAWNRISKAALQRLSNDAKGLDGHALKDSLVKGVREIALSGDQKKAQTLTRYTLNRALKVIDKLDARIDLTEAGAIDQEIRLLKGSIEIASKFAGDVSDAPAFAAFGIEHAQHFFKIAESLLDSGAQLMLMRDAFGLLQWDLYRDQGQKKFAPVILQIEEGIKKAKNIQDLRKTKALVIKWLSDAGLKTDFRKPIERWAELKALKLKCTTGSFYRTTQAYLSATTDSMRRQNFIAAHAVYDAIVEYSGGKASLKIKDCGIGNECNSFARTTSWRVSGIEEDYKKERISGIASLIPIFRFDGNSGGGGLVLMSREFENESRFMPDLFTPGMLFDLDIQTSRADEHWTFYFQVCSLVSSAIH